MATITTNTFLDDGVARTAGEAWTCNGGILTVRTDTRWHANAPVSMGGSLGSVTISATLGGGYYIDATRVRWMAFDAGSGNVPVIGTEIRGGTSTSTGYLLGVWESLTSAPTAVGASMPPTGFIKFREVSAPFVNDDALTGSTLVATANGVDKTGWIEVVHDQVGTTVITVPRLGKFQTRGDWFYLDNTTGAANQLIQVPTNGSATTYVPGVWIETAVAGVYEYYPSMYAANMITANFGTDVRSKFVCMETNGRIRIGHNGTTNVCHVPPAGRKVRIPNILGRQCTTAARATNALPHATMGARPEFLTSSGGAVDIEKFATDWYVNLLQPYSFRIIDSCYFDAIYISEVATPIEMDNIGSSCSGAIPLPALNIATCFGGGTIENSIFVNAVNNFSPVAFQTSNDFTLTNVSVGITVFARSVAGTFITTSDNINLINLSQFNCGTSFVTATNCTVINIDHTDRYVGATTGANAVNVVTVSVKCDNILFEGLTFGMKGTIANCHPYNAIAASTSSTNIKIRNLGTRSSFLNGGSTNNPGFIFISGGNNVNVKVQRVYMTPTRLSILTTNNADKNILVEHVYGDFADAQAIDFLDSTVRNCGATNSITGAASCYGTFFWDAFTSDTAGRVILALNEQTAATTQYYTYVSGTPKFTSAGNLVLAAVNDQIIIECPYFIKGCTALDSAAPVITGTNVTYSANARWGNHDIYYQIDTGSGYGGSWKNLTGALLSGETISPSTGFKLKIRMVCATAATNNLLTYIRINTVSTLSAQGNNLYPLDTVPVKITVKDAITGSVLENARVYLLGATSNVILNKLTDASGIASVDYALIGSTEAVTGVVRLATTPGDLYIQGAISSIITSSGLDISVLLIPDE